MSRPSKVTPAMVRAVFKHTAKKLTSVQIADKVGLGASTVRKLRTGQLPLDLACTEVWQQTFGSQTPSDSVNNRSKPPSVDQKGAKVASYQTAATAAATAPISRTTKKLAPEVLNTPEAVPVVPSNETEKEEPMLLQHQALSEQAKKHFKLFRSPFANDINTQADVYTSGPMAYVRHALWDCAQNHGFMAVVGESGSGKTTLREEFEERIRESGKSIIVIKPFVVGMEVNDLKGKTMKCGQIADAIARTLSPGLSLKSNPDARFEQVKQLLVSSVASGYSHLILIEEAHRLPQATLRHLKGFMELKEGMRRLLGVCLVGQPELDQLLGANQREIREIVQRCERVTLEPLGDELDAYLAHKFERTGADVKAVLAPDAYAAIKQRLSYIPRGGTQRDLVSICYPLVINNLVCRAMNAAANVTWEKVDAQVIAGC